MDPVVLQQATLDRTGIYVATGVIGAFALIGLYFLVRSRVDRYQGKYDEQASYVLGTGQNHVLVELESSSAPPPPTHRLGRDGLKALLDKLEGRADMNVTLLVLDDGNEVPLTFAKGSTDRMVELVVQDSRGEVRIDVDGRVTARPPLDDAVRRDLEEVLRSLVG